MNIATDFSRFPELRAATLPAEDQDVLRSLSPSELPVWIDTRVEELQSQAGESATHVATLHYLRNTQCVPISHLPNEVLMRIFGHPPLAYDGDSIRGVCRLWRFILLDTPLFWANYISIMHLNDHESERILSVALLHSGALPISLITGHLDMCMLRVLETCRGRITKWHVSRNSPTAGIEQFIQSGSMTRLHTLTVNCHTSARPSQKPLDWDTSNLPALRNLTLVDSYITPSIMVSTLESLTLSDVHQVTHQSLAAILKRCPMLDSLYLFLRALRREQQDSNSAPVDLPRLRRLIVMTQIPSADVAPFLRIFVCIPKHAIVWLSIKDSTEDSEYQLCGISSLPFINRLYILSSSTTSFTFDGYIDSHFCLHLGYFGTAVGLAKPLQPFLACPLVALVIDLRDTELHWLKIREQHEYLFALELPHLRRLELPDGPGGRSAKQAIAELFLGRYRTKASQLSLAWVLSVESGLHGDSEEKARSPAAEEVEGLLAVLREHVRCGNPRLGRLEMYAVEWANRCETFTGDIKENSDARICSRVVEPFLAELRGLVDEVHIG